MAALSRWWKTVTQGDGQNAGGLEMGNSRAAPASGPGVTDYGFGATSGGDGARSTVLLKHVQRDVFCNAVFKVSTQVVYNSDPPYRDYEIWQI